jgi:hypothetical protein
MGRQATRVASLFNCHVTTIGVNNSLQAVGNLIDTIDAGEEKEGVVLVNVAPRTVEDNNGAYFGWFRYKDILVVTTLSKDLCLLNKLGITSEIKIPFGTPVLEDSQFRSFEYTPFLAQELFDLTKEHKRILKLGKEVDPAIWWIDNFGNCKTTLLEDEVDLLREKILVPFYGRLRDVPYRSQGITVGSSGIGTKRFLEVVVRGGRAIDQIVRLQSLLPHSP